MRAGDMHPALRVLGVMLFIPVVAHGGLLAGLVAGAGVAVLLTGVGPTAWRRCLELNRRLRWFFVSIILLYGWFTPGRELLPAAYPLSPTLEGLLLGLGRVMILAIIVGAVVWLLARSSREDLVGAILWLTAPLAGLGFPRERFAVRLVLTLEAVPRLQPLVAEARDAGPGPGAGDRTWAGRARALLDRVIKEATEASPGPMEISIPGRPRWDHWLMLCVVLAPLFALALWRPL
jgi:energy-coupling factor transporter transmembrane protein EcfT